LTCTFTTKVAAAQGDAAVSGHAGRDDLSVADPVALPTKKPPVTPTGSVPLPFALAESADPATVSGAHVSPRLPCR
jgi:hypothetical protein